jgi:hypothetical protein
VSPHDRPGRHHRPRPVRLRRRRRVEFDSLREAANAAQLGPKQLHGQIVRAITSGLIEPLRVVVDGVTYDCTRPTEHQAGVHRLIRHYVRTSVPVVVGVAS